MRPDIVVIVAPQGQRAAGLGQVVEDFLVEAFVAQTAVEALDVTVLLGFPGVDVVPFDLVVVRPFQDGLAGEIGAVACGCVFRVMVGIDFTGSRAVISREAGH